MMARKCDRCHAAIPDDVPQGAVHIHDIGFWINDYTGQYCESRHYTEGDFCDDCSKDFLAFLNKYKEGSQ